MEKSKIIDASIGDFSPLTLRDDYGAESSPLDFKFSNIMKEGNNENKNSIKSSPNPELNKQFVNL